MTAGIGWEAAVFDLDGVLTFTARIHAAAWTELFDGYLRARSERAGAPFRLRVVRKDGFDAEVQLHIDGLPPGVKATCGKILKGGLDGCIILSADPAAPRGFGNVRITGTATVNGPAPPAFSSRHHGGALFGFCDGSVRLFRAGGDPEVLRWLAGRNDGKVVSPDF